MTTPADEGIRAARPVVLNQDDMGLLAGALRCAASKYDENVRICATFEDRECGRKLAEQFEQQSSDAIRLAELIEDSESVQINR